MQSSQGGKDDLEPSVEDYFSEQRAAPDVIRSLRRICPPVIAQDEKADAFLARRVGKKALTRFAALIRSRFSTSISRHIRESAVVPCFTTSYQEMGHALGKNRGTIVRLINGELTIDLADAFTLSRLGILDLQGMLARFQRLSRAQVRAIGMQRAIEQTDLLLRMERDGVEFAIRQESDVIDLESAALLWAAAEELNMRPPDVFGEYPIEMLEKHNVLTRILARARDALDDQGGVSEIDYSKDKRVYLENLLRRHGYAAYLANRATIRMCPEFPGVKQATC